MALLASLRTCVARPCPSRPLPTFLLIGCTLRLQAHRGAANLHPPPAPAGGGGSILRPRVPAAAAAAARAAACRARRGAAAAAPGRQCRGRQWRRGACWLGFQQHCRPGGQQRQHSQPAVWRRRPQRQRHQLACCRGACHQAAAGSGERRRQRGWSRHLSAHGAGECCCPSLGRWDRGQRPLPGHLAAGQHSQGPPQPAGSTHTQGTLPIRSPSPAAGAAGRGGQQRHLPPCRGESGCSPAQSRQLPGHVAVWVLQPLPLHLLEEGLSCCAALPLPCSTRQTTLCGARWRGCSAASGTPSSRCTR